MSAASLANTPASCPLCAVHQHDVRARTDVVEGLASRRMFAPASPSKLAPPAGDLVRRAGGCSIAAGFALAAARGARSDVLGVTIPPGAPLLATTRLCVVLEALAERIYAGAIAEGVPCVDLEALRGSAPWRPASLDAAVAGMRGTVAALEAAGFYDGELSLRAAADLVTQSLERLVEGDPCAVVSRRAWVVVELLVLAGWVADVDGGVRGWVEHVLARVEAVRA